MKTATVLLYFLLTIVAALIAQFLWVVIQIFWIKKNPGKALDIAGIQLPS